MNSESKSHPNALKKYFGYREVGARIILELKLQFLPGFRGVEICRKTGWYVKSPCDCMYSYGMKDSSGNHLFNILPKVVDECPVFKKLWGKIEEILQMPFNSCNISYYGNETAETPPHTDDENIFLSKPRSEQERFTIASVRILCPRDFKLSHMSFLTEYSVFTSPFDILLMKGKFQWEFLH